MGILVCQDCGAQLYDHEIEDLNEWNDEHSMGWDYICPKCGYNNYKEIIFKY